MKKTLIIIAIMLGITLVASAQNRGLFGYAPEEESANGYNRNNNESLIYLPTEHGQDGDQTPLGTGALLLIGFGAAYALKKKASK